MSQNIGVIIIDKLGSLKSLIIKEYKEDELYKKCGFKKPDGFKKQTEWKIKLDKSKYNVEVYGKIDGKANTENKYDFPPPIDNTLFFGSCLLVCYQIKEDNKKELISLSLSQWDKMYEKLFGGFEDLTSTIIEDELEEDELELIPTDKKTKTGYLKDGFVVDSDSDEKDDGEYFSDEENETEEEDDLGQQEELVLDDIGSELSEEEYSDED